MMSHLLIVPELFSPVFQFLGSLVWISLRTVSSIHWIWLKEQRKTPSLSAIRLLCFCGPRRKIVINFQHPRCSSSILRHSDLFFPIFVPILVYFRSAEHILRRCYNRSNESTLWKKLDKLTERHSQAMCLSPKHQTITSVIASSRPVTCKTCPLHRVSALCQV